ncbi:MAG: hypothetical protein CM15mP23_05930 [Cryomorphaceae bacterium]|nr:MAG: hypothetical protein CM15mP23_05930 [Cryomorphaceae bacterium]
MVVRKDSDFLNDKDYTGLIATSSNRRKSQWIDRYEKHSTCNIRGNVQTRIKKLRESNWDGAIFAAAGLERLELSHEIAMVLDWMIRRLLKVLLRWFAEKMIRKQQLFAKNSTTKKPLCVQASKEIS